MDFGIARAIADTAATMTQTQSVVGTAQYLSPEQAQGQTVDERSDLYSTGCLLFELLAGRPPFTGDSPVAIAYQHVGELPQPPSVFNDAVGGDLDAVTLHALAKDREARYQNAVRLPGRPRERPARPIRSARRRWAPRPPSAPSPPRPSRSRMPSPAPRRRCSRPSPRAASATRTPRACLPSATTRRTATRGRAAGARRRSSPVLVTRRARPSSAGVPSRGSATRRRRVTLVSVPTIEGMKERRRGADPRAPTTSGARSRPRRARP